MNSCKALFLAVSLIALIAAGCQQSQTIDTGGDGRVVQTPSGPVAQTRPIIDDLPMPIGFDLDRKTSWSSAAAGLRMVNHRYKGKANMWAVGRFYKREMDRLGWQLQSDRMVLGTVMLGFVKDHERCELTIHKQGWSGTGVHAQLYWIALPSAAPRK